ncbi:hypothetical protein [Caminibacter mediatlanticus]|uniref:Uncharacterized protein n=1 Tax=Caminibacter mediatlanticus TB-2 TaxID=391592 RepID=A0AAI9AHG7_9BACT|nr:hypothetical protein [Caminibacter mediatlanticus]EDM23574.1 hypothetical protein CMTB2_04797 [Caminibacter mediatlanticus TB-2]
MSKIVSPQELAEKFSHIKDSYVLEIATGKTWAIVKLDEPQYEGMYQLIEPVRFEDNMEKIAKGLKSFFEKLKKEMGIEE